jgi:hypothetical protein
MATSEFDLGANDSFQIGETQNIYNKEATIQPPSLELQLPTPHASVPSASSMSSNPFFISGRLIATALSDTLGVLEMEGNYFPDFLKDLMMPSSFELSSSLTNPLFNPSRADTPFMDLGLDTNLELSDLDMGFLDAFSGKNFPAMDLDTQINEEPNQTQLEGNKPENGFEFRKGVALGVEAFRKSSLWGWAPAHQDHGYAEQGNLTLPVHDADSPETRLSFDRQILGERLSLSSRDKILAMVLETVRPTNITRVVSSFPSAEILDNLMQHFFDQTSSQIDSSIHVPTFRANAQRPEYLAIIVAAGALHTPLSTVRKLGFALQEAVRLSLPMRVSSSKLSHCS